MLSLRDSLLSSGGAIPGYSPSGGWPGVIQQGLGLVGTILQERAGRRAGGIQGVPRFSYQEIAPTGTYGQPDNGEVIQAGAGDLASALDLIRTRGGVIIGKIIEIAARAWRAIPGWAKSVAIAAGYAVTLLDGDGGGGGRRRRGRGLTATQIKGYWRVLKLVRSLGMTPRRSRGCPTRRKR